MIGYRLAHQTYVHDTSGTGARIWGGRWNPEGQACVYTSMFRSLALLEKLAHKQPLDEMKDIFCISFIVQNPQKIYNINEAQLKKGWQTDLTYTQWLGHQILNHGSFIGFIAPSVIIPEERNIILLPEAIDNIQIKTGTANPFLIDARLIPGKTGKKQEP